MAEDTYQHESRQGELSPRGRKTVTYCSIALLGAVMGFAGGMSYQHWLSQPISALEERLNEDEIFHISVLDRELNRTVYIGTAQETYTLPTLPAALRPYGLK